MTRSTSARVAGFMFLFYVATAFPAMVTMSSITGLDGTAAQIAGIASGIARIRLAIFLYTLAIFNAFVLGVALYGITRVEDEELSLFALCCRIAEGIVGAVGLITLLGLRWIATGPGGEAPLTLAAFLLEAHGWSYTISAMCFAVGSTVFAFLLYRSRSIPVALSALGIFASLLVTVLLPAQLLGFAPDGSEIAWWPMLLFEITLGIWLMTKGVAGTTTAHLPPRIIPWA